MRVIWLLLIERRREHDPADADGAVFRNAFPYTAFELQNGAAGKGMIGEVIQRNDEHRCREGMKSTPAVWMRRCMLVQQMGVQFMRRWSSVSYIEGKMKLL